ncbi:MAG: hypothetical protein HZA04_00510 [Nitrospinae bacterium]|nr:hypothetical protein [Nitrospinota bacterium]
MAMMMTCKEAVETLASSREVSLYGKMKLRFHLLVCGPCAWYNRQLKVLKAAIRTLFTVYSSLAEAERKRLEDSIIVRLKEKGAGDEGK